MHSLRKGSLFLGHLLSLLPTQWVFWHLLFSSSPPFPSLAPPKLSSREARCPQVAKYPQLCLCSPGPGPGPLPTAPTSDQDKVKVSQSETQMQPSLLIGPGPILDNFSSSPEDPTYCNPQLSPGKVEPRAIPSHGGSGFY